MHVFDYGLARWMGRYLSKSEPVVDLGCGRGTYLQYLQDIGFYDLVGVDGAEIDFDFEGRLLIRDLATPGSVSAAAGRNVICLEVAEHVPVEYMHTFLDNVTGCVGEYKRLIMSWAVPGQGGYGHENCRHNIWVVEEMRNRGFKLRLGDSLDARAAVTDAAPWFRNTIMVFERI